MAAKLRGKSQFIRIYKIYLFNGLKGSMYALFLCENFFVKKR
jgi:hypothetical protein